VKYRFSATRTLWRSFGKLSAQQQEHARKTFAIFKLREDVREQRAKSKEQKSQVTEQRSECG
jgi:sRNA-binding protein